VFGLKIAVIMIQLTYLIVYYNVKVDHIFCIRQILEKNWEHSEAVHQLFIDFKKAYDSVGREAL
jgi:hypothetical protein